MRRCDRRGGLKRAVVAIEDPDPRVAGRGLDRLRAAGLEVVRGVGAAEARWLTRGHIVRVTERRPLVTLKLALDADGESRRAATGAAPRLGDGRSRAAHGHLLRARADAILVGAGTVRDDDPELTCRLPGLAAALAGCASCCRTISTSPSRQPGCSTTARRSFRCSSRHAGHDGGRTATPRRALAGDGCRMVRRSATVGGRLWLPAVMEALVARGITRLLVEGGPTVWRAFADASLVDEVVLYMAGSAASDGACASARSRDGSALRRGSCAMTARRLGADMMWRLPPRD